MPGLAGARLSFVVRHMKGKIKRAICSYNKDAGGISQKVTEVPAGYIVYFPMGHAIHVKDEQTLKKLGFDKKPRILDMDGIHDPNSPLGQLMTEQKEEKRAGAYQDMEQQVINLVTHKCGPIVMGQIEEVAA